MKKKRTGQERKGEILFLPSFKIFGRKKKFGFIDRESREKQRGRENVMVESEWERKSDQMGKKASGKESGNGARARKFSGEG